MNIMEEREEDCKKYWIIEIALSGAFFSISQARHSRSNKNSGSPGSMLADVYSALAVSGKREQRVL